METTINYWASLQLNGLSLSGRLHFENAVQRTCVWDNDKKSLFVHSMLAGYPIPPVFVNIINIPDDVENQHYDVIDGKQRLTTILSYMKDEFATEELDEEVEYLDLTTGEHKSYDVSNKKFSQLPEALKEVFKMAKIMVISLFASEDSISEIFFRLNNGKALSTIEHARATAKDIPSIQALSKHEIFTSALTEKALAKYTHEEMVIKSEIVLFEDNKDLSSKSMRERLANVTFTQKQLTMINKCYTVLLLAHKKLIVDDSDDLKLNKKIAKRILMRTHFITLLPIIKTIIEKYETSASNERKQLAFGSNLDTINANSNPPANRDIESDNVSFKISLPEYVPDERILDKFIELLKSFFICTNKGTTTSSVYNQNSTSGSTKHNNVMNRLAEIQKEYDNCCEQLKFA